MSQYLTLPRPIAFFCRHFAGIRKGVGKRYVTAETIGCEIQHVKFPFNRTFMDEKRLVAIACGAIEAEEIAMARRCLTKDDKLVEFGMGLGVAATLTNHACQPLEHHCFEANPAVIPYASNVFSLNRLNIRIHNKALGNGKTMSFFAVEDYMLSSFDRPEGRSDVSEISVPTIRIEEVLAQFEPTALFCDIEGAELAYLDPAHLGTLRKIIVELHPDQYGETRMADYISTFRDNGFNVVAKAGTSYLFVRSTYPPSAKSRSPV